MKRISDEEIKQSWLEAEQAMGFLKSVDIHGLGEDDYGTEEETHGRSNAQAQLESCEKEHDEVGREIKLLVLQAITDEPEYPSEMPDELWQKLKGNRVNASKAMRSTVRLTKNGITERFLQALKEKYLGGEKK